MFTCTYRSPNSNHKPKYIKAKEETRDNKPSQQLMSTSIKKPKGNKNKKTLNKKTAILTSTTNTTIATPHRYKNTILNLADLDGGNLETGVCLAPQGDQANTKEVSQEGRQKSTAPLQVTTEAPAQEHEAEEVQTTAKSFFQTVEVSSNPRYRSQFYTKPGPHG